MFVQHTVSTGRTRHAQGLARMQAATNMQAVANIFKASQAIPDACITQSNNE